MSKPGGFNINLPGNGEERNLPSHEIKAFAMQGNNSDPIDQQEQAYPWDGVDDEKEKEQPVLINLKRSEHLQMIYLKERLPMMSIRKIIRTGISMALEQELAKLGINIKK